LKDNQNGIGAYENQNQLSNTPIERNNNLETIAFPVNPLSARLMNAKIVRIHPDSICACVSGYKKIIFNINTISRVDDREPANENETPLFYVEEKLSCSCCCFGSCKPFEITFEIFDALTKELFSTSRIDQLDKRIDICCGDKYIIYAPICNFKASNPGDISIVNRYDSRSFYRTYDHLGQSHYKIGQPYVEQKKECCDECSLYCFCSYMPIIGCCISCCKCEKSNNPSPKTSGCTCDCKGCCSDCCCCCCCCCCEEKVEGKVEEIIDKRIYIDIFTMLDQPEGKFAYLFEKGFCCQSDKLFYEIYFPPDATEMVRLALIAQIIFFYKFRATGNNAFISLPGSRNNIEQFMS
jgi:hypothetical protein